MSATPFNDENIERLATLIASGETIAAAAQKCGLRRDTVSRFLNREASPLRLAILENRRARLGAVAKLDGELAEQMLGTAYKTLLRNMVSKDERVAGHAAKVVVDRFTAGSTGGSASQEASAAAPGRVEAIDALAEALSSAGSQLQGLPQPVIAKLGAAAAQLVAACAAAAQAPAPEPAPSPATSEPVPRLQIVPVT